MRDLHAASFDELVAEAVQQDFSGWDFSFIRRRCQESGTSWDYREMVIQRLGRVGSLLDMGTGGGEFLCSLKPLPPDVCATEGYAPNLPLARRRLEPLGVCVAPSLPDDGLPFADARFDLVINRHEAYSAAEVRRVLRPGGRFLTQQVGGHDNVRLNELLEARDAKRYGGWRLARALREIECACLRVTEAREEFPETVFTDIGAVVYYLRAIPWQIEGFSVDDYRERLRVLHERIQADGRLVVTSHRFLIEAVK